ncbi:unnamed protein product [Penicillium roqueforti FM164]|uniref:Genomic scaffold, ProqFM164S02 n=1 Tax=Penicillium roqueforti (strain FM164) TaxID=1365484 RepID=W6QA77_PENRF|nr:unnamed protein product [Penicillium roqueforti FM164]
MSRNDAAGRRKREHDGEFKRLASAPGMALHASKPPEMQSAGCCSKLGIESYVSIRNSNSWSTTSKAFPVRKKPSLEQESPSLYVTFPNYQTLPQRKKFPRGFPTESGAEVFP